MTEILETGNEALDQWANFFNSDKKKITDFINLLKTVDKYYLTVSPSKMIEDTDYPDDGLLENDFRTVAFRNSDPTKNLEEKNRIALALLYNTNFTPWKNKYKDLFSEVIESCLIEGSYEEHNIAFEKILSHAISKGYLDKSDLMGTSILRGILLDERYPTPKEQKSLVRKQKINKLKQFLKV